VVAQLAAGVTTTEAIGQRLSISVNTVRSHLARSLRKTGLSDRTQLALWGARNGLGKAASSGLGTGTSDGSPPPVATARQAHRPPR